MILDYPGGPISSQSLLQEEEEGTGSESERSFEGATRLGLERQEGAGSHRNVGGLEELKKPRKQIVPPGPPLWCRCDLIPGRLCCPGLGGTKCVALSHLAIANTAAVSTCARSCLSPFSGVKLEL